MSKLPADRIWKLPAYQVEDEEGRTYLLIHLPIEADELGWCPWRPDLAGFDSSRSSGVRWLRNVPAPRVKGIQYIQDVLIMIPNCQSKHLSRIEGSLLEMS
jgi:hypothetical protein